MIARSLLHLTALAEETTVGEMVTENLILMMKGMVETGSGTAVTPDVKASTMSAVGV